MRSFTDDRRPPPAPPPAFPSAASIVTRGSDQTIHGKGSRAASLA